MLPSSTFQALTVANLSRNSASLHVHATTLERYERIGAIAKQKVFVVDDEAQIADVVSIALREAEFDVETFYDARSALLRASVCLPDILVSDIVMPGMDGIALADALREQSPDCKVILMSGTPDWRPLGGVHGSGADDFTILTKPFPLSQLLLLVKSRLGLVMHGRP
jgi:DNA-binding NtrC family response regulator